MGTAPPRGEKDRRIRVLHCPTMIGGNPQQLARAERELGIESWSVAMHRAYFDYPADEVLLEGNEHPAVRELQRWRLLWRALRDFDLVHFNYGQSLMPYWSPLSESRPRRYRAAFHHLFGVYARALEQRDLRLLRQAGKGIVVTFQGDDARQGDFCRANFEITFAREVEPTYYTPEEDEHKRRRIARFARYADRIYALNPDLLRVLPPQARFLPYANVDLREWRVAPAGEPAAVTRVVHAPSHRGVKGTRHVIEAVSQLQAEGIPLEFSLVEGLSNAEARKVYERSDLLIDQLLAGWYGGLAVELMALGKPVFGYLRQEDLEFIPRAMREQLPIIDVTPATLYEVLREYLTRRRDELPELGRRGRAYVEAWHEPRKIAAQLKRDYEEIVCAKGGGDAV